MSNLKRLIKGLVAGDETAPLVAGKTGVAGDLSALKPHSIMEFISDFAQDWTLFRMYQTLPKKTQDTNVFTYRQKVSRTNLTATGFVKEAERGAVTDSTYTSKTQVLKYIRIIRKITDVAERMYLLNMNPTQLQIDNAVKDVISIVNKGLIFGDSDTNPDSMDGIVKLHKEWFGSINKWYNSNFVLDLRGAVLDVKKVNNGARIIQNEGFGIAKDLIVSTNIKSVLENAFYDKGITRNIGLNGQDVKEGVRITTMATTVGDVRLQPELALSYPLGVERGQTAVSGDAPLSVTFTVVPVASALTCFGKKSFEDANGYGDYIYAVRPFNRFGLGAMTLVSGVVAIANGESAEITITDGNLSNEATGYLVYRSKKNDVGAGALLYPLFEIGRKHLDDSAGGFDGAVSGKAFDHNRYLPETEFAFLVQADAETWEEHCLKEYDMNIEFYAKTSPSREVCISRGTNATLYFPYRMVTFLNCGGVTFEK